MYTLIKLIIIRNWKSISILFFTFFLTATGAITVKLLTENVSESVARETRPLFGADLKISYEGLPERPLMETFSPYLSGADSRVAETREFSTTLFDQYGKPGLINVIAYSGSYPQKGILETEKLRDRTDVQRVSVSDDLLGKYSSGGMVRIDGRDISFTDRIIRSSDMGFSFGQENALIILPIDLLSGSLLISSGSRLDSELFVSFARESDALIVKGRVDSEKYRDYRIRTYIDRSEQSLEVVDEVGEYTLLILLVVSIFAIIIMRSAHDRLFASLSETLRIVEILGFTRKRQVFLFAIVYSIIYPLAMSFAAIVSYLSITLISRFPGAEGFVFLPDAFIWSVGLIMILFLAALYPAWRERFGWTISLSHIIPERWLSYVTIAWRERLSRDMSTLMVSSLVFLTTLFYIFSDLSFSLITGLLGALTLGVISLFLRYVYVMIFTFSKRYRDTHFTFYDAVRTHVRPLSATLPITLSLALVSIALIIFIMFSLAFRSKLILDSGSTANVYAINILEQDRAKVETYMADSGELYSIIRARITQINDRTLAEHLGVEKPSGEFTREYNITTSKVMSPVIRGKKEIGKDEVSVDEDFSKRLSLDIGDRVTFLLSGRDITVKVANIRKSEREGFRPFFYFSLDPESFSRAPKTYFAATYASDIDSWKKGILENSGPHVTFVDIENILTIVRDISGKILSVISLFLGTIAIFAVFAIIALFGEMANIENMKRRLYPLFGMIPSRTESSLSLSRGIIYIVSYVLSIILGGALSYYLLSRNAFFSFSFFDLFIIALVLLASYVLMWRVVRR